MNEKKNRHKKEPNETIQIHFKFYGLFCCHYAARNSAKKREECTFEKMCCQTFRSNFFFSKHFLRKQLNRTFPHFRVSKRKEENVRYT